MVVFIGPARIVAIAVALLSVGGTALAQGYYYRPWGPEYGRPVPPAAIPGRRFQAELPPWEIETMLRSMGYSQLSRPRLAGSVYEVNATDRRGWRIALVVDSDSGRILERETLGVVVDPRDGDEPPVKRSRPSQASRTPAEQPSRPKTAAPEASLSATPAPVTPAEPSETVKPPEVAKPSEPAKPSPAVRPVELPKPAQAAKPSEAPKPSEGSKPAVAPAAKAAAKPADAPKPATPAKAPEAAKAPETATPSARAADPSRPIWAQRRPIAEDTPAKPVPPKKPNPAVAFPPIQGFE